MIHMFMALISFLGMIIGMFLLTRTFGLLPAWRPIMRLSVLFPADALALFIVRVRDRWLVCCSACLSLSFQAGSSWSRCETA
jgi:hypothetical protein